MHDWIWDLPTLHIDLVKRVVKIEPVIACWKRKRLVDQNMVSKVQEGAAHRYMSATTVFLLLYSIVVQYDE